MRPLEILIPILLVLYLVWPQPRPWIIRLAPLLAVAAVALHWFIEGYRWQMIPLYLLTLALAAGSVMKTTKKNGRRKFAAALTLILLAFSTALPILLPVPKIPAPRGDFSVGTRLVELTDTSRMEIYSGRSGEPRRFMIQAWYPAALSSEDSLAPWMADAALFTPAISGMIGMPFFFLDHLALAKTPAFQSPQISDSAGRFPLIIFSHGWKGFSASNTSQAIELASRGYVVIALHHTYGAITTVFADGTVVPFNPAALPADENDPNYEEVARKVDEQ